MFAALGAGLFIFIHQNINNKAVLLNGLGMIFAHTGIAIMILGIGVVSSFSSSKEVIIAKGESTSIQSYELKLTEESFEN